MNFYRLGVPTTVVIDDYLPLIKHPDGRLTTLVAGDVDDKSLWGLLAEKALAKFHGNYSNLHGGYADAGLRTLTGAPYKEYKHKESSAASVFAELLTQDGKNSIMQA